MRTKNLNRAAFLAMLIPLLNAEHCTKNPFGKNSYIFSKGEIDIAQVEFISKSNRYTFTIYIRAITEFVPTIVHETAVDFVKKANLNRNIFIDSDFCRTMV